MLVFFSCISTVWLNNSFIHVWFLHFHQPPLPWSGLTPGRSRGSWVISFSLVSLKRKEKKKRQRENKNFHQLNDAERHLMSLLSSLRQHAGDGGLMFDCKMWFCLCREGGTLKKRKEEDTLWCLMSASFVSEPRPWTLMPSFSVCDGSFPVRCCDAESWAESGRGSSWCSLVTSCWLFSPTCHVFLAHSLWKKSTTFCSLSDRCCFV